MAGILIAYSSYLGISIGSIGGASVRLVNVFVRNKPVGHNLFGDPAKNAIGELLIILPTYSIIGGMLGGVIGAGCGYAVLKMNDRNSR